MTTPAPQNPMVLLQEQFSELMRQNERLQESLDKKVIDLEDIGWTRLNYLSDPGEGLSLKALKDVAPNLQDMAAADPLHVRGAQLRHAYVFGKGINFTNLTDRTKVVMKAPYNQAALFSVEAYETNNLALFTDGNFFVVRRETDNLLTVIPLTQITAEITDPDDPSRVRYFLREWHDGNDIRKRWYPVSRYKKTQVGRGRRGKINKTISISGKAIPVAQDAVIYHKTTKRQAGWTYGVPDSLAAAVWSVAYKNYLSDNATLVKALQQFAWTVTTATKAGQNNAAVQVATGGVGGTAVQGSGNYLASAGVPSANVNFNNGQPLAAMVATSFGVPVIALLSSPGATGGSYGAATTLDTPTIKVMKAIQDSWALFYEEILMDMGSPEPGVSFPNISEDPIYRTVQAVGQAYADGRLWQDEARGATLDLLDVESLHTGVPKPDKFNAGTVDGEGSAVNNSPSQGNTGATPGGTNQDDTNHDGDAE